MCVCVCVCVCVVHVCTHNPFCNSVVLSLSFLHYACVLRQLPYVVHTTGDIIDVGELIVSKYVAESVNN